MSNKVGIRAAPLEGLVQEENAARARKGQMRNSGEIAHQWQF